MTDERRPMVTGDGVELEAELAVPDGAWAGAVLAHPHPRCGGDMRSPLIEGLFAALPPSGVAAVRFNFRGVGRSGGRHTGGRDEPLDVVAALDGLVAVGVSGPVVTSGWSFGADVSLCVTDTRLAGWFCMAPVFGAVDVARMGAAGDPRPKLLAVPEHDQYRPPDSARAVTETWEACRIEVVAGTDHFFAGAAGDAAALLVEFLRDLS